MKKLLLSLLLAGSATLQAAPFTFGDLAIYRVGDGSVALSSSSTAVFIDEYTTGGSFVQSIALPTVTSGSNFALTASGNAGSEGLMTLSPDGTKLTLGGYAVGTGSPSVASSAPATINRVVGIVDASGAINTTTAITDLAGNIRGTVSDGSNIWATSSSAGLRYTTLGTTGTSTQISSTVTNLRAAEIWAGQLSISDASGSAIRIGTVGVGEPTTSGQTITNLPGFSTSSMPYAYAFADLDGTPGYDTLYVADASSTVGLQKWTLTAGTWALTGNIASATLEGLTVSTSGSTAQVFVTSGSNLLTFTDSSGYGGTLTGSLMNIATAPTNTAFRGVAFVPTVVPEPSTIAALAMGGALLLTWQRKRQS